MKQILRLLIVLVYATFFWGVARAQSPAQSPDDQLNQMVAQLQKSPNDQALREKIINLALTLNPKPPTPDAATEAEGAAEYAFKNAKVNSDFSDAAKQYEKALLLAPWLAADYFNCGVAYEKAGEDKDAIRSFNLYLLAAPNADDAQAVKKRIGGLQYVEQKKASDDLVKAEEAAKERFALEAAQRSAQMQQMLESFFGGEWYSSYCSWRGKKHGLSGCTLAEAKVDKNWYVPLMADKKTPAHNHFVIGDGTVEMVPGFCYGRVVGFTRGPSLSDMVWKLTTNDGTQRQIWSMISEGTRLVLSCGRPLSDIRDTDRYVYVQYHH
ncbi:MAG: hypothetical protein ACYDDI_09875 [Candidatus Acidiferrales bacterium]